MMNSYFEQSGFYGGHGQTGAEQAYRFPLGLGVNPYGPPSGGVARQVDSYDQATAAAAAAAASCKLYEQQYKLDCTKTDQSGYGSTGIVKTDNNSISSWAAAAAAAAAAAGAQGVDRAANGHHVVSHNNVNGRGVVGSGAGYPGVVSNGVTSVGPETAVTPRSNGAASVGPNNNPWSPCSINTGSNVPSMPQHGGATNVVPQHGQHGQHQPQQPQQQHHNSSGQHAVSQQASPQSQSSSHTFYPWMAIAGESFITRTHFRFELNRAPINYRRTL